MTRAIEHLTWVAALVFGALLMGSPAVSAASHADTCRYFSAQAFQDRHFRGGTTFKMDLAQDCIDAMVYAQSGDPVVRDRALAYLDQLETYRTVLVAMLVDRANERDSESRTITRQVRLAVTPVSWAGAYLIARRMGLVDTHENWTTWRRSYAAADSRLRIE